MNRKIRRILAIIVTIAFIFPPITNAKAVTEREDVFAFVQAAHQAQLLIGDKPRTINEIDKILSPYFTTEAKAKFLEEHLFSENGLYITYGTDFPIYYIPSFTFTEETKLAVHGENMYVFEFFLEQEEGPVSYDSHYEGIKLSKKGEYWKIAEFLYDNLPDELEKPGDVQKTSHPISSTDVTYIRDKMVQSSLQVGLCRNPIEFLIKYGSLYSSLNYDKIGLIQETTN